MHNLTWTFNDDVPRYRHEEWRKVFDGQSKATPLSLLIPKDQLFSLPLAEERESFEVRLSKEKLWERYCTLSHIANLQGEEREVWSSVTYGGTCQVADKMIEYVQEVHGDPLHAGRRDRSAWQCCITWAYYRCVDFEHT